MSEYPAVKMIVPEGADVKCDANCPGAQQKRAKLGPIPLPYQVEVCPVDEARAIDGHSQSALQ